ncbi:DUF4192 domain-containing protein [uncultured Williamsia sp.]|uniref:DUF4192 domain-containing protein n=1 Tax=uncultured Williamsia sp. TaxID=259311 RepID=UPI00260E8C90|nr:DUF4192 domain-containing protein [uncultured Williamsia sp.]
MSIPRITFRTLTDLVSAIPALVGFIPRESVVAVLFDDDRMFCTARVDLRVGRRFITDELIALVGKHGITRVAIVVVAAENNPAVTRAVTEDLARAVEVAALIHLTSFDTGTSFHDSITGQVGTVTDVRNTAVAVAQAVHGAAPIAESREAREDMFAMTTPVATDFTQEHYLTEGNRFAGAVAADLLDVITGATAPTPLLAARIGVLTSKESRARDALMWIVRKDFGRAADTFRILAGHLRGDHRAQLLTLAAACYAYDGDSLAGQTLEAMQREKLTTPLAELLDVAIQNGMSPMTLFLGTLAKVDTDYIRNALHGWTPPS